MKKRLMRIISLVLVVTMALEMCGLEVQAADEVEEFPVEDADTSGSYVDENSVSEIITLEDDEDGEDHEISIEKQEQATVLYEVEELREESAKHFRMSDGSYIAVQYETAVHYEDEDGEWEDIDNRLVAAGAAVMTAEAEANSEIVPIGLYEAENGDNAVRFPARLEDGSLYYVTSGRYGIQLSLGLGMAPLMPEELEDIQITVTPAPEGMETPEATETPEETESPETTPEPEENTPTESVVEGEGNVETVSVEAMSAQTEEGTAESGDSETTPAPEVTPEPETTQEPETTPEPEETESPEVTPEPEETEDPETTPEPEETENPEGRPSGLPIDRPIITFDPAERIEAMLAQAGIPMFNKVKAVVDNHEEDSLTSVVAVKTGDATTDEAAEAETAEAVESTESGDGEIETPSLYDQIRPPHIYSEITYPGVYDGVNLQYILYGNYVKENIIIEKAREEYSYTFSLNLQNLTPVLDEETGAIHLMDGEEIAYEMPAPYMYDASGAASGDVAYGLAEVGNGQYVVVIVADEEWINAEEREFPVTIDPTLFERTKGARDCITSTYTASASAHASEAHGGRSALFIGRNNEEQNCTIYMQIKNLPTVPKNCVVVDSELVLWHNVNGGWSTDPESQKDTASLVVKATLGSGTKPSNRDSYSDWINQLTYNSSSKPTSTGTVLDYQILRKSTQGSWRRWNITRAVTDWYQTANDDANRIIILQTPDMGSSEKTVASLTGWGDNVFAPYFIVAYRNTVGVESYYTYKTAAADRAGTAYIGDASRQMTLIHDDIVGETSVFSFNLSHVYNSANALNQFTNSSEEGIHTQDFTSMQMGKGWKLSAQETITTIQLKTGYINDTTKENLIYNDADGTEHYFEPESSNSSTFKDEDGLGLTITKSTSGSDVTYTMTDKDARTTKVFYNGYLISVADVNGNTAFYAYNNNYSSSSTNWKPDANSSSNKLIQIVMKINGDTVSYKTMATLTYNDSNYLSSVTDYANRVTSFGYDTSGRLTTITHPDGMKAYYLYGTSSSRLLVVYDNESKYGIYFTFAANNWGGYRVNTVREYTSSTYNGTRNFGKGFSLSAISPQITRYQDYGADHTSGTSDDLFVYCLFDNWGRTINSITRDSTMKKTYGVSASAYQSNEDTKSTNNRMTNFATLGAHSPNLLLCNGFENIAQMDSVWTRTKTDSGDTLMLANTYTVSGTTVTPHNGKNMLIIKDDGDSSGDCTITQEVSLTAGVTYTLSAYVNVRGSSSSDYGTVELYIGEPSGGGIVDAKKTVDYQTVSETDGHWERMSLTFTAEETGTYSIGAFSRPRKFTIFMDDFQLEENTAAGPYNILQNDSFESSSNGSTYWVGSSGTIVTTTGSLHGSKCLRITGSPTATKHVTQSFSLQNGTSKTTFILSGWGQASSVCCESNGAGENDRFFGLIATINYTDTTYEEHPVPFNDDYTGWQYASAAIVPKESNKTISSITVAVAYDYNANNAYFDHITLQRDVVETYAYDSDGNPVSATSSDYKTACEYYQDTSLIKSYTNAAGVKYEYQYDSGQKNLEKVISDGVTTTYTHQTNGTISMTKTTAANTDLYFLQKNFYSNDGLFPDRQQNENGVQSGYYNYNNYFLPWRYQYPNFTTEGYSYIVGNGRTASAYISGVIALGYTYENGLIGKLNRKTFIDGEEFWQQYDPDYDAFGNGTELTVRRSTDGTNWSSGRTLSSYTYESGVNNGRLTRTTYGNGAYLDYEYDMFDRVTAQTYNDGIKYEYEYNAEGNLASQCEFTDYGIIERLDRFEYDSLGRLITTSSFNPFRAVFLRTEHAYDAADRLISQGWQIENDSFSESYSYDSDDSKLTEMTTASGAEITLVYDVLKRLRGESTTDAEGTALFDRRYEYRDGQDNRTTHQINEIFYVTADRIHEEFANYRYTYNMGGNIASEEDVTNSVTTTYTYGTQDELLAATLSSGKTYTYTYDTAGNIRTSSDGTTTHTYSYDDPDWADLLTSYDGVSLTYDEIGNPTSYYNGTSHTMTWEKGRRLSSVTANGVTTEYRYDINGIRTEKYNGSQTTEFITLNGQVMRQRIDSNTLDFIYDSHQQPYAVICTKSGVAQTYYYVLNLQGDVVGLANSSGHLIAQYTYDAWGKVLSVTDIFGNAITSSTDIANVNPLRYRGYYYDTETGFYYLQSRYYDPKIGRFINSDGQYDTDLVGGLNMFAYCGNNPVNRDDQTGKCYWASGRWCHDNWEYQGGYVRQPDPSKPPVSNSGTTTRNSGTTASNSGTTANSSWTRNGNSVEGDLHFSSKVEAKNYINTVYPVYIGAGASLLNEIVSDAGGLYCFVQEITIPLEATLVSKLILYPIYINDAINAPLVESYHGRIDALEGENVCIHVVAWDTGDIYCEIN